MKETCSLFSGSEGRVSCKEPRKEYTISGHIPSDLPLPNSPMDPPTNKYSIPMIQSPSKCHMLNVRLLGDLSDLNSNKHIKAIKMALSEFSLP